MDPWLVMWIAGAVGAGVGGVVIAYIASSLRAQRGRPRITVAEFERALAEVRGQY
ncbi:MAG: hypothetical protein OXI27_10895 [Thaumarchaeota archaeon]|nr:hypothetical protein [Nitrososphaerota archaeon]